METSLNDRVKRFEQFSHHSLHSYVSCFQIHVIRPTLLLYQACLSDIIRGLSLR